MWWNRKRSLEHSIDAAEAQAAMAVERIADGIQERIGSTAGAQLAANLRQLAGRIDELDLAGQLLSRRRGLERAARKASRQVQRALHDFERTRERLADEAGRTGQQLATLGQRTLPDEPARWIVPTLFDFAFGFAFGFAIAYSLRPKRIARNLEARAEQREPGAAEGAA